MSTIPTCYYTPSILKLIDLYIDMGSESFDDLSDAAKDDLTAQCIEALGEDAYSCIIEENFMETVSLFKKFIISGKKDDSYELATLMNENAKQYFREPMNELFSERLANLEFTLNTEHGFFPFNNRSSGEIEWRKSA